MSHSDLNMRAVRGCSAETAGRRAVRQAHGQRSFGQRRPRACRKAAGQHGNALAALVVWAASAALFVASPVHAQRINNYIGGILGEKVLNPDTVAMEVQNFALRRLPPLAVPGSADAWTSENRRLRERYLREIVFHGWPQEWVTAPLRSGDKGEIPTGGGYRLRKLQIQIVPGFQASALLYLPANLQGKAPAILDVNGHDRTGSAALYKQRICINQALRGMVVLSIDFMGFGEMAHVESTHQSFGPHLDLIGANAVGLFYLAMRRGLDYLYEHPQVDRQRIAMTGLSGGGWQTIVLSALDERVAVSIPVGGYGSTRAMIYSRRSIGDIEQTPTDMHTILDYTHLTAMRAPRPTLLVYNAEDDCCFRAPLVKPDIYDDIKPVFRLYGSENHLAWHQNIDPGYHNYEDDNRQASYAFLLKHFKLPGDPAEIRVDSEMRTAEELRVGLPSDNLTILGVARKLAAKIKRPSAKVEAGEVTQKSAELAKLLRYPSLTLEHAFATHNTRASGVETITYRFQFSDGLSASGVWLKLTATPDVSPATIVLQDKGRAASAAEVAERVFRGEQVLAVDLIFIGEGQFPRPGNAPFARLLYTMGVRPLGIQAAHLHAITDWLKAKYRAPQVKLEVAGLRTQALALVSAALRPGAFNEITVRDGISSLNHLLDEPVKFDNAPELFCLGLWRDFDLDDFVKMSGPTKVRRL